MNLVYLLTACHNFIPYTKVFFKKKKKKKLFLNCSSEIFETADYENIAYKDTEDSWVSAGPPKRCPWTFF